MANKTINDFSVAPLTTSDHLLFQAGALPAGVTSRLSSGDVINPESLVVVSSEADLPVAQDLGDGLGVCHHLEDGKIYFFGNTTAMLLFDPIAMPSSTHGDVEGGEIRGNIAPVVYLGAGAAIRSDANGLLTSVRDTFWASGTGTNDLFDLNGSSVGITNSTFAQFGSVGQITSDSYVNINSVAFAFMGGGLTLTGNSALACNINVGVCVFPYISPIGGNILTIEGALVSFRMSDVSFEALPGDASLYIDPTTVFDHLSMVHTTFRETLGGDSLAAGSLGPADIGVVFRDVLDLQDSTVQAHLTSHNNVTPTVIVATNRPEKIANSFILDDSQRVDTTPAGRMTYKGIADINLNAKITASFVAIASGPKASCGFYFNHGNDVNNLISSFVDLGGGQVQVTVANWDKYPLITGDTVVISNTTNYNRTWENIQNVVAGPSTTTFEITTAYIAEPPSTGNWAVIDQISRQRVGVNSSVGDEIQVIVDHEATYSTDDYIEPYVENRAGTANIIIGDCVFIWRA